MEIEGGAGQTAWSELGVDRRGAHRWPAKASLLRFLDRQNGAENEAGADGCMDPLPREAIDQAATR